MTEIPRMRTIKEVAAETGLAVYHVRRLCKEGKVVAILSGSKYLINLDKLIEYLNTGEPQKQEEPGKIRRIGL